jgi:trk system potassium uptake protein TrkH
VPGFTSDQLTPRITSSAKILWGVYLILTLAEAFLLWMEKLWNENGMTLFDAVCTSFATLATGGFSTLQSSIGGYDSAYVDVIITIFMFLAGCNFVLHFRALRGKPLFYFKGRGIPLLLYSDNTGHTSNLIFSGRRRNRYDRG